jgi:hypothetical protein
MQVGESCLDHFIRDWLSFPRVSVAFAQAVDGGQRIWYLRVAATRRGLVQVSRVLAKTVIDRFGNPRKRCTADRRQVI